MATPQYEFKSRILKGENTEVIDDKIAICTTKLQTEGYTITNIEMSLSGETVAVLILGRRERKAG